MIDDYSPAMKFLGNGPIAVTAHLQRYFVNVRSSLHVSLLDRHHWRPTQTAANSRARETDRLAERSKGSLGGRSLFHFLTK
jgi:hypothetical protein